jgi:hypothetical protein
LAGEPPLPTLYRRALGGAFDTLPPVLHRFHDQPNGGCARGAGRVTWGEGWLPRAIAALARMPRPGDSVSIHLRVVVEGERERWVRQFDGRPFATAQWLQDGLLVEAVGPFRLGFVLVATPETLRFELVRCWLFAFPVPPALRVRVEAVMTARPQSWWVDVRVDVPLLGRLVRYEGEVVPE